MRRDYQSAILAREIACLIVDMYELMGKEERERLEKEHKWTYKLFKQSDLDKLVTGGMSSDDDADGRRATKLDIQKSVESLKNENRQEIIKLKKEMQKEIGALREEIVALNKDLKEEILLLLSKMNK